MKIKTEKKDYQIIGAKSKTFSVDTNDTMVIKLLRDKMYKNKIGAVAREISSNCRDANREAGKTETPIIISIEREENVLSDESVFISFQDNGIGISPERMENIFLKYGSSTKRDTDKYTGGFGIGAKTPFAYTDNFFIETVTENEKGEKIEYLYQAVITSDGISEVSRMIELGSNVTNKKTGTKITVPLKEEDVIKFEKEVIFFTNFWSVKPIFNGFSQNISQLDYLYEDENCIIFNDEKTIYDEDTKFIVLIDEIPYELNINKINNELEKDYYNDNESIKWIIKFNTGEITVSGSREDVEYTKNNIIEISNKIEKVILKGRTLIDEFNNSAKNFLDACIKATLLKRASSSYLYKPVIHDDYIMFLEDIANNLHFNRDDYFPVFEGEQTLEFIEFKILKLNNYSLSERSNKMLQKSGFHDYISYSKVWEKSFYLMDLPKMQPSINASLKMKHGEKGYVIVKIPKYEEMLIAGIVYNLEEYKLALENDLKLFRLIGVDLTNYSSVEKLKTEKSKREKSDVVNVNVKVFNKPRWDFEWTSFVLKYDKKNSRLLNLIEEVEKVNSVYKITKVCYYEKNKLSDFKIDFRKKEKNSLPKEIEAMRKILLENGIQTIGVSSSKVGYFKGIPTIEEAFSNLLKEDKTKKVEKCLKSSIIKSYNLIDNELFNELKIENEIKKSLIRLSEMYKDTNVLSSKDEVIEKMLNIFKDDLTGKDLEKLNVKLDDAFESDLKVALEFLKLNPMLNVILKVKHSGYSFNRYSKELQDVQNSIIEITN